MTYIAICDDEKNIGWELEGFLIQLLDKQETSYKIEVYYSGKELWSAMEGGTHYDLIFLDIEFAKHEINGVEVGQLIRGGHGQNQMVSIVYISWEKKYAMELFELQPFNFLIKPLKQEKVEDVVKKYLQIAKLWSETFTYKLGHDTFKVQIKDIVYLESYNRKLILHLIDGRKEEFYGSIKEIYEEQLKKYDFLFIHKSYLVNFDSVASLQYSQVVLFGDTTPLPISKHRRNEVKEAYYAIMDRRGV